MKQVSRILTDALKNDLRSGVLAPLLGAVRSDRDQAQRHQQDPGIFQHGQVGAQSRQAEKDRHEEGEDQPAQLLIDMPAQDRRFSDQHAGNEGAQHRVHPDRVGRHRGRARERTRIVVSAAIAEAQDAPLMASAMRHAVEAGYRFYSYGDACLLSPEGDSAG